ncbi:MAG: roadblock/LC7 domain-containing protein [Candidatus Baldrarchaeia archaeon]|mgnify:CR=1 FL=1
MLRRGTKRKELEQILEDLEQRSDIMASAIVTKDGLMMAGALPKDIDEDTISAMAGMMLGLGTRVGDVLKRGEVEQVIIRGKNGFAIITDCGPAVLIALAPSDAKLGMLLYEMKTTAEKAKELIK